MPKMIHSKYGYEPSEYVKADTELEKWLADQKAKQRPETDCKRVAGA
ncbi:hypothetical protein [Schleiferilactobacillus harbinensis]|nr:hypothetical protein [Schleiferilactobacillus harbinensis]